MLLLVWELASFYLISESYWLQCWQEKGVKILSPSVFLLFKVILLALFFIWDGSYCGDSWCKKKKNTECCVMLAKGKAAGVFQLASSILWRCIWGFQWFKSILCAWTLMKLFSWLLMVNYQLVCVYIFYYRDGRMITQSNHW